MEINRLITHMANSTFKIITVNKYCIEPGSQGMYKTKDYPGLIFHLSGVAEFKINGSPYIVSNGSILHGCANSEMFKRVIGEEPWEYILILYEIADESEDVCLSNEHFQLQIGESQIIVDLLDKIWKTHKKLDDLSIFEANTLFRRILQEIFFRCKNNNSLDNEYEKIIEYIECHYMEDLTVSEIAEKFSITENRITYIFKKYTGAGIKEYIIMFKINIAKELLKTTNLQIVEISQKVGFEDQFYFSRIFKKKCGISPLNYKNNG